MGSGPKVVRVWEPDKIVGGTTSWEVRFNGPPSIPWGLEV